MLDNFLGVESCLVRSTPSDPAEAPCNICPDVRKHARDRLKVLTQRERDVLRLIVNGKSNKVAAFLLKIGQRSIENHRANIMHKTGAKSQCELVCLYIAGVDDGLVADMVNEH